MKKILSFLLAALMLVSMVPTALAADVDVSEGTTIRVVGTGADTYTVTVPAKLAPGESGTVKANGTWPSNQTLNVTAPSSVTLTHGTQTMDVGITFDGISQVGSDTGSVSAEQTVAVASASALFGTWTGTLTYTVEMVEDSTGGDSGSGDDDVEITGGYATFTDDVTLTWEELKLEENGTTYNYDASVISDTEIGKYAFANCENLRNITIPEGVATIGDHALSNCKSITSITLPSTLITIDGNAFSYCDSLTNITIPKRVTSIGDYAFAECYSLAAINVDNNNSNYCSIDGVLYNKDKTKLIRYPNGKTDTMFIIPEGVLTIELNAFKNCKNLNNIAFPSTLTFSGKGAFIYCDSLTSIDLSNTMVTNIGESSFLGCTSLASVTLPSTLTTISNSAFYNCNNLKTVNYTGTGDEWSAISIGSLNDPIKKATINYNYTGE